MNTYVCLVPLSELYSFDKSINRRVISHSTYVYMPSFQIIPLPIYCQTLPPPKPQYYVQ
jgi:hypothetical protein